MTKEWVAYVLWTSRGMTHSQWGARTVMGMLDEADFRRASSIDRVEMLGRVTHGKRAVYAG